MAKHYIAVESRVTNDLHSIALSEVCPHKDRLDWNQQNIYALTLYLLGTAPH